MKQKYKGINTMAIFGLDIIIKKRNNTYVIADLSAADVWGFSPFISEVHHFIIPKGYNPNNKSKYIKFNQKTKRKIQEESTYVVFDSKKYKILYKEATFVRIIKGLKNDYDDQYMELIKMFFNSEYDTNRLKHFAKTNNLEQAVCAFEATYA